MRVTRTLIVVFAAALAVAGCAQTPGSRGLYAPAVPGAQYQSWQQPQAQPQPRFDGIDGVLYGSTVTPPPRSALVPAAAGPLAYAAPGPEEGPYTLDSGDRLRIVVFGQEGLTNSYFVDAGGNIDMPLIGMVPARGATTNQLAARIADKLRQGFVREPHVAVEIEAYRPFFILGEVTQPGQYPYVANMSVETAVAIAGGFTPRAFRKTVTVSRPVNGEIARVTVPMTFALHPGDTVNVQERWF
jgi:polysaccharide biosynthesis/export protein